MQRRSSKQGADPSSRLGDLTLRNPHYQTGPACAVNCPKAAVIPSISHNETFKSSRHVGLEAAAAIGVVGQLRRFLFG
jgi:hypothetical protein